MQPRAAIQGAIQYRAPQRAVRGGQSGRKARAASRPSDAFAFLNQRIEGIRLSQSPIGRVRTEGLCARLAAGCRRLFEITGDGFPIAADGTTENMVRNIEQMTQWAEAHNLSFMAHRLSEDDDVNFVLYREEGDLELRVFHFFISPADTLPEALAALYRRFVCFTAASLGISVMPEHTDNRYLDMMMNSDGWYDDDEDVPEVYKLYNHDERIRKRFEAVRDADFHDLGRDLTAYRRECDPKHLDLVELMMEGMELLPAMHISQFDFDPYRDGFDHDDGEIELLSTLAVLYSPHDGMEDALLEAINSDNYCGLLPQGWNRWLILSPDISPDEWQSLADTDTARRFLDWSGRFYEESVKFDNYKKEETKE